MLAIAIELARNMVCFVRWIKTPYVPNMLGNFLLLELLNSFLLCIIKLASFVRWIANMGRSFNWYFVHVIIVLFLNVVIEDKPVLKISSSKFVCYFIICWLLKPLLDIVPISAYIFHSFQHSSVSIFTIFLAWPSLLRNVFLLAMDYNHC